MTVKLQIDKVGPDVKVSFTPGVRPGHGGATAPVAVTIPGPLLPVVVQLLETARKADRFSFTLEL
jgi:hypothetical protein